MGRRNSSSLKRPKRSDWSRETEGSPVLFWISLVIVVLLMLAGVVLFVLMKDELLTMSVGNLELNFEKAVSNWLSPIQSWLNEALSGWAN